VPLCLTPRIERIAQAVTGRSKDRALFDAEVIECEPMLRRRLTNKRVLVVGGAGSIGSATIVEVLKFSPAALTVLDTSENNLAELTRTLRSGSQRLNCDLQFQPLDYGSSLAESYLAKQFPFDLVLSFAALKHVRSERDEFSLLRMLEVNLLKADRFLGVLRKQGHGNEGVFFVSTDKAASPINLMGASKRVMEMLLWAHGQDGCPTQLVGSPTGTPSAPVLRRLTTTRFANVAFSDGSLPWSFLQRIEKRQPLAAPRDVRRFLISPREAGRMCLLASLVCPDRHLMVPFLHDEVSFTDIAERTLAEFGLKPQWYENEDDAKAHLADDEKNGRYPVVATLSDTTGEKMMEEFVGRDETELPFLIHDPAMRTLGLEQIAMARLVKAAVVDIGALSRVLSIIDAAVEGRKVFEKRDLVASLSAVLPHTFHHHETGKSLDGKM
jgi:FlaA1/EpsC-like NDP-sugar epimerase